MTRPSKLVFLVEEPSMKDFLDGFLPRVLPADLPALDQALGTRFTSSRNRAFKRDPDTVGSPSDELAKAHPAFQKRATARAIAPLITTDPAQNRSHSFGVFLHSLSAFAWE
jgi:hypothetical protein